MIGAAGDQSYAALCFASPPSLPPDHRAARQTIRTLTPEMAERIRMAGENESLDQVGQITNAASLSFSLHYVRNVQDFLECVETVFQSRSCLNGSLLLESSHRPCTSRNCGVDFAAWKRAFECVERCRNSTLRDAIHACLTSSVMPSLVATPPDVETLRVFLILPLYQRLDIRHLLSSRDCQTPPPPLYIVDTFSQRFQVFRPVPAR